MRIAIDCRLLSLPDASNRFWGAGLVTALLNLNSGVTYFLVFDQAPPAEWKLPENATSLVLKPAATTAATRALWYDLRLPALLSGHKIDFFIGMAGYISLRTPVPQILLLHDALNCFGAPSLTGWQGSWYKRRLPSMVEKACHCMAPTKVQVQQQLPETVAKSVIILPFCPFQGHEGLLSASERTDFLHETTGGLEYFFCEQGWQTTDDATELLLAFSAFKKRMQSGLKLVLAGHGPVDSGWNEKLSTFRYSADVVLISKDITGEYHKKLYAASYAVVHLPTEAEYKGIQLAFCSGVPVISWPGPAIKEIGKDAVLYCTDAPGEGLSQNLMRIYKDEKLRNELVAKGLLIAEQWNAQQVAQRVLKACF